MIRVEAGRSPAGSSLLSDHARRLTREDVMTVEEVAAVLELKPPTVYAMARRGELPCARLGRTVRCWRDVIEARLRGS